MSKYVAPFNSFEHYSVYSCPHCAALCSHHMGNGSLYPQLNQTAIKSDKHKDAYVNGLFRAECSGCKGVTLFFKNKMVYPSAVTGPTPVEGMPENVRREYEEARSVALLSPKSSAALLRLALQHLCKHLGGKGKNINEDIATLVSRGLSVEIQKALDIVRVVGNNAVHPGEINLDDTPEMAGALFGLINLIVDRMINEPERLDQLFNSLPPTTLDHIKKRDGT